MQPGYYRDYDSWLYVNTAGGLYLVRSPDTTESVWKNVGPPMGDDAVPRMPDAEDLALFERTRVACGIPE
jgi:hypothetical protein